MWRTKFTECRMEATGPSLQEATTINEKSSERKSGNLG